MADARELMQSRGKTIVRTSIIGIGANILLAAFKAFVGLAASSVAIVSDAVNNLTDALSSIITIVGTKLAAKAPDKKHPMGHGRAEYMTALVVSAIVFYAGITIFIDSVKKIVHPSSPSYTAASIIILAAAVVVKIILGSYTKAVGKRVNSGSLEASGADALNDAFLSSSVLASAVIFMIWGLDIEAYIGILIAIMILKAAYEMISEAVSDMLGKRADKELSHAIKQTIARSEGIHGVYDLILNNYGPENYIASAHVEVDDNMTAAEIDALSRVVQAQVYSEHSVILAALGVYAVNTGSDEISRLRSDIRHMVMQHDGALQMHGFFIDQKTSTVSFDVIIDFAVDRQAVYQDIVKEVSEKYPQYRFYVALDTDFSD